MNIKTYKTEKIDKDHNLYTILDNYLPQIEENSIIAIASKIVGICEGRIVKTSSEEEKDELIKQEADYYLQKKQLGFFLTITKNIIVANAGIDASNSNGYLSLWPKDPQKSANKIRAYLVKKFKLKHVGVILTDSKLTPLRMGITAYAIAHSGFYGLKNYVGKQDIFGRKFTVEKLHIADSLACSAAVVMGEGAEQQPFSVITDVPFVAFQERNPTQEELDELKIAIQDDIYASLLTAVKWERK